MFRRSTHIALIAAALSLLAAQGAAAPNWRQSASPPAKRTLKPADYAQWESISGGWISPDGRWFAYAISLVDGDGRLVVRSSDGPEHAVVPLGSGARFSDDGKWVAYTIGVPKAEAERLREQKKPVENSLGLRNLANGSERRWESVQSWTITKGGKQLLMLRYRPAARQTGGSDFLVWNLGDDTSIGVSGVVDWEVDDEARFVALEIETDGPERGIQVLDLARGTLRNVHWGKGNYSNLAWAAKAPVLAFMAGTPDPKKEGDGNVVFRARGFASGPITLDSYEPAKDPVFPAGMRIVEFGGLSLNDDGSSLAFGIKPWTDRTEPKGKPEDKPNVDVWHSKDVEVQPLQARQVQAKRNENYLCVWRPEERRLVQIGTENQPTVRLLRGHRHALIADRKPYESSVKVGGIEYADFWLVDLGTGARTKLLERRRMQFGPLPSPKGGFLAYYDQKNWWVYDIAKGRAVNATGALRKSFEDPEEDLTVPEKSPADSPDWLADDAGMIVYTQYDPYLVPFPSCIASPLIERGSEKVRYRLVDIGFHEEGVRLQDPWYFAAFDETTKASGYYRREPDGKGKLLVMDNSMLAGLRKSKNTDRVYLVQQTFEKSPDILLTNEQFTALKPMTRTNPQQTGFLWGKAELVSYKSKFGKELQGTLIYPADYQPGRQYPMVTYIYERMSDQFHLYRTPVEWSAYNVQVLSQNGYFVLMPDIAYRDRNPGISAVECLELAVKAVLDKKVGVDPKRVGLMGHSWGGYQTAFVVTQSKVFSAAVAGAPLTELMSMYNSFYWNWGEANQVIFESSQGRMGVPWWEDMKAYMDNSPVFNASKITAKLMIAFGDADGAVDWHQGQYLYNTMRRMGKEIVMLVYPGENHGLARRPNQLDYARRVRHFFDVHLQGAKPEPWLIQGVPFIKKAEG